MSKINGGALGFLDGLNSAVVNFSAAAASTAANVAAAKDTLKGPQTQDKNGAPAVSTVQTAVAGIPVFWIVGGLAIVVVVALLLRRKG